MDIRHIKTIAVCGAGAMGAGIAQVAATAGYAVVLYDISEAMLNSAGKQIDKGLDGAIAKGKLVKTEKENILRRLQFSSRLPDCKADLIIEAITEKIAAKTGLLNELMELNGENTIYATNTSSLRVTAIAAATKYPGRVAGMHFFNPAPVMKLVEVVCSPVTENETLLIIRSLAEKMNKIPVMVKDAPGFIVNRVARHFYLESMRIAEEGIAGYKTIDTLLESTGFKMGPFALTDLIGQDINFAVTQSLYEAFHYEPRFRPSRLQEEKVLAKQLGRKTGMGFYEYDAKKTGL